MALIPQLMLACWSWNCVHISAGQLLSHCHLNLFCNSVIHPNEPMTTSTTSLHMWMPHGMASHMKSSCFSTSIVRPSTGTISSHCEILVLGSLHLACIRSCQKPCVWNYLTLDAKDTNPHFASISLQKTSISPLQNEYTPTPNRQHCLVLLFCRHVNGVTHWMHFFSMFPILSQLVFGVINKSWWELFLPYQTFFVPILICSPTAVIRNPTCPVGTVFVTLRGIQPLSLQSHIHKSSWTNSAGPSKLALLKSPKHFK